jgi:glutamate dehydrogenase (NAD(P)+)
MAWVKDEIGRAVGLPAALGGIPLDEVGATGWGIRHAAEVAAAHCALDLRGARVVIQGFGAVGIHSARFLADQGAVLVGAADSRGTIHDPKGLDVMDLVALKGAGKSVGDYRSGRRLDRDAVLDIDCDIWIPAARPDVVREDNVHRLKTRLILQAANIPFTAGAEQALHDRGVLVIPDFIANAGGVICAAMEYRGASQASAFAAIEENIRANVTQVLEIAKERGILPREAGRELATARVRRAMSSRRFSIF